MGDIRPDWIAADWGTSHGRVYAMTGDSRVLARAEVPGMRALAAGRGDFETSLRGAIDGWRIEAPIAVVACGMVGSRQGWAEAPYLPVPCDLGRMSGSLMRVQTRDPQLTVFLVPGLSQAVPPDVMRGEETQLAGYRLQNPKSGTPRTVRVCLPGTHSKWVELDDTDVRAFRTFMTGELFDVISTKSLLQQSLLADDAQADLDQQAFCNAVLQSMNDPAGLTANLFGIRTQGLLGQDTPCAARSRLSGLLIGAELAAMAPDANQDVVLIGASRLCAAYRMALEAIGVGATVHDGDAMVLAGLCAFHQQLLQVEEAP